MTRTAPLDRFDRALLDLIQRDNQTPARLLGERVGLSESAVLRRLRRLRQDGFVAADVAVLRPAAVGLPLTVHVLVTLEREGAAALDAFTRRIRARREVRRCWYVTGEADFILILQLPGMEAYDAFTRTVFHDDPNVKSYRSFITMREVVGDADAPPLLPPD